MEMKSISNLIVKKKKLLFSGHNHTLVMPKKWLDEMNWTRQTKIIMEFLPHRKTIIISEELQEKIEDSNNYEENSDIVAV